jgi:hypothetical protein
MTANISVIHNPESLGLLVVFKMQTPSSHWGTSISVLTAIPMNSYGQ